jgi:hypothetical protein
MAGTKGIEAYERDVGGAYRKSSDGLDGNEGSGSIEMNGRGIENDGEEVVDEVILAQGIQALESKRKHWYTYMTTKDFWLVLLIGFVCSFFKNIGCRLTDNQTSPRPLHHCYQHFFHPSSQQRDFNPRLPNPLQLHPSLCSLHTLHYLPLRLQEILQGALGRWLEVCDPLLHGR